MRIHWTARRALNEQARFCVRAATGPIRPGLSRVSRVIYTRCATRLMDWDNAGASFKPLGDALVKNAILEDDGPAVIEEFVLRQRRVGRRADEGTVIEIEEST